MARTAVIEVKVRDMAWLREVCVRAANLIEALNKVEDLPDEVMRKKDLLLATIISDNEPDLPAP